MHEYRIDLKELYSFEEIQSNELLGKTKDLKAFNKYVASIQVNGIYYVEKQEIERLITLRKISMEATKLAQTYGWDTTKRIKNIVLKLKSESKEVEWITNHPFDSDGSAIVKGYEKVMKYIDDNIVFNKENYLVFEQIQDTVEGLNQATLKKYVKPIKLDGTNYYPKKEIESLISMKQESVKALDLAQMIGWKNVTPLKKIVEKLNGEGRNIEWIAKHPFGGTVIIRKYDELLKYIRENLFVEKDDYYEFSEIKKYEEFKYITQSTLNKYIQPVKVASRNYYSKERVDYFLKLRKESIEAKRIAEIGEWVSTNQLEAIVKKLRAQGKNVEYVSPSHHPFGKESLIVGYEEIMKYAELNREYRKLNTPLEKTLFKIDCIDIGHHEAVKTLEKFKEFIRMRYEFLSNFKSNKFIKIYKYLVSNLESDITRYECCLKIKGIIEVSSKVEAEEFNMFIKWLLSSGYTFKKPIKDSFGNTIESNFKSGYVDYNFLRNVCINYIYEKEVSSYYYYSNRVVITIKKHLENLNINYHETKDNIYVEEQDGLKFQDYYKNFKKEDYYSAEEIKSEAVLGLSNANGLNKYVKPIIINQKAYYLKKLVQPYLDMKRKTMEATEIAKMFEYETIAPVKTIVNILKSHGKSVEYISNTSHPFDKGVLILGYEEVIKYAEKEKKIKQITDTYEKFEFLINDFNIKNKKAKITLKEFCDFVKKRYNARTLTKGAIIKSHTKIYKWLAENLVKEFIKYNAKDLKVLLKNLLSELNTTTDEMEINYFIEYCNNKYYNSLLPYTKYSKKKPNETDSSNQSYTNGQWDQFMFLVFSSIDDPDKIKIALDSRACAMSWLFFSLSFVSAMRFINLKRIPKPDLSVINFNSGEDFINHIRNNGKFTKFMGEAICENAIARMKAFGEKSNKTLEKLVLIIGDSMVRQIGLLLALCEAHRQIVKSRNKRTDTIITDVALKKEYHKKLFGEKYDDIFNGETFGNLKATNTYLRYVQKDDGALGLFRAATLRGHRLFKKYIPKTTANIYITHAYINEDKEIDNILFNLIDRPVFSFAPYMILQTLFNKFNKLSYDDQTKRINELGLSSLKIENLSKSIIEQENETRAFINIMMKENKKNILRCLTILTNGEAPAKHHFSNCMLKAMIKSEMNSTVSLVVKDNIKNNCIIAEGKSCYGCKFLVAEKLFLYELGDKYCEIINKATYSSTERDRQRYRNQLKRINYILFQAISILGVDTVGIYIDLEKLKEERNQIRQVLY